MNVLEEKSSNENQKFTSRSFPQKWLNFIGEMEISWTMLRKLNLILREITWNLNSNDSEFEKNIFFVKRIIEKNVQNRTQKKKTKNSFFNHT